MELAVLNRLRDAEILAAVRDLPRKSRTVIALCFGAQLSNLEIAEQLGMRPTAVSMALKRALMQLHRALEGQQ
ncbi:MAG: sigma-70 family RNA polymerase sigma factor [Candidatus Dormibacteraeota bacterium]|uniref:Sigma-70 family RNA polymerase sigma factor n=1 Tax=Candidatus Aeolococcus gillhamiae TaxID=3127015 RepID=A0A934JYE5_9BACT|nr:sigma-70 family RNA polymerase sigma factor [Candidatus Dormibacteraeota bacterium]